MDIFKEQLVIIKPTPKTTTMKILIYIVAVLVALGSLVFSILKPGLATIAMLLGAAAIFFGYKFASKFNIEYEYINTNGEVDIDCIINKRDRQRMATFNCSDIEDIQKYNPVVHKTKSSDGKDIYFACTPDELSYALKIKHPKKGYYTLVFSPNNDFKESMKKYLPYLLKNNF